MHTSRNNETQQAKEKGHNAETVRSVARWTLFLAGIVYITVQYLPNNFSSEPALDQTSTGVDTSQNTNSLRP